MNRPVLFLHIGTGKTGTTSLQKFLANHSDLLESKGFYYTEYRKTSNHSHVNIYNSLWLETYNVLNINNKNHDTSEFDYECVDLPEKIFTNMKRSMNDSRSGQLIISSEAFFSAMPGSRLGLTVPDEKKAEFRQHVLGSFKKYFADFDIKIICYLRRQDVHLESSYNQFCKAMNKERRGLLEDAAMAKGNCMERGSVQSEVFNPFESFYKNHLKAPSYYHVLSEWAAVYGKENIIVRPYEKCQLPKGVVYDFLKNVLGFADEEIPEEAVSVGFNKRMKRDILEHRILLERDGDLSLQKEYYIINKSEVLHDVNDNQNFFSTEERINFMNQHKIGNERIAREYLHRADGKLFYDEIPTEQEEYPGLSVNTAIKISRELIKEIRRNEIGYINEDVNGDEVNIFYKRLNDGDAIKKSVNAAIYGSGKGAYQLYGFILRNSYENASKIKCVIEMDGQKIGKTFMNLPIKSIEHAINESKIDTIIIGSKTYQEMIYNRISYLLDKGINIIKIFAE